ncbi:hypothetical protein L596_014664 [Steinernema carpocapsae]|uniref:Uncharacterized protein n=1 Tax=Steinernema carpocapsae TaxID=34508 RepID=A0A4U5NDE6_STECR|nr:hypothetical protein L596_014664 [Steinernema carpocapsae]
MVIEQFIFSVLGLFSVFAGSSRRLQNCNNPIILVRGEANWNVIPLALIGGRLLILRLNCFCVLEIQFLELYWIR